METDERETDVPAEGDDDSAEERRVADLEEERRRRRDGWSGWWYVLLLLVLVIGGYYVYVLYITSAGTFTVSSLAGPDTQFRWNPWLTARKPDETDTAWQRRLVDATLKLAPGAPPRPSASAADNANRQSVPSFSGNNDVTSDIAYATCKSTCVIVQFIGPTGQIPWAAGATSPVCNCDKVYPGGNAALFVDPSMFNNWPLLGYLRLG